MLGTADLVCDRLGLFFIENVKSLEEKKKVIKKVFSSVEGSLSFWHHLERYQFFPAKTSVFLCVVSTHIWAVLDTTSEPTCFSIASKSP